MIEKLKEKYGEDTVLMVFDDGKTLIVFLKPNQVIRVDKNTLEYIETVTSQTSNAILIYQYGDDDIDDDDEAVENHYPILN